MHHVETVSNINQITFQNNKIEKAFSPKMQDQAISKKDFAMLMQLKIEKVGKKLKKWEILAAVAT